MCMKGEEKSKKERKDQTGNEPKDKVTKDDEKERQHKREKCEDVDSTTIVQPIKKEAINCHTRRAQDFGRFS